MAVLAGGVVRGPSPRLAGGHSRPHYTRGPLMWFGWAAPGGGQPWSDPTAVQTGAQRQGDVIDWGEA